jgi:hypothetical protein
LKRNLGKWRTAQKITLIPGYHEFPINLPTFFRRLRPNLSDTMNACWEQTGGFDALMKYAVFHCTTQSGYEGIINAGLVKKNKPVDKVIMVFQCRLVKQLFSHATTIFKLVRT